MEEQLFNEIAKRDFGDVLADLTESGLDELLDDGVLKNIPVIGTVKKVSNIIQTLRDNSFSRKLLKFLLQLQNLPYEKRLEFYDKVVDYGAEYKKVGETTLLIIDKLDSEDKAIIIGKLMRACMNDSLLLDDYFRLCTFVNKAYLTDLLLLHYHKNAHHLPRVTKEQLYTIGLLKIAISNKDRSFSRKGKHLGKNKSTGKKELNSIDFSPASKTDYDYNSFGELLRKYGF